MQVRHRRPGARQALFQPLLGQHHGGEIARRAGRQQGVDAGAVVGKHRVDRRPDVLGPDLRKRRQGVVGQQRVVVTHGCSFQAISVATAPGEIKHGHVMAGRGVARMCRMNPLRSFKGVAPRLGQRVYVDPAASVIGDVVLGDDVSIWPGTVLRGDVNHIRVGARTNIQDGAIVHVAHAGRTAPASRA